MNSYNDNLHATVVGSLAGQEQDQKNMKSKLDASMFTLYFTQGARINASQLLEVDTQKYDDQQQIKDETVNDSNIAINLLAAANQQKQYTTQAVSNAAICAANVQVAANAIVHLASDVGSIFSILRAADAKTEIYKLGKEAYRLMNETAYRAEKVSQTAMEVSSLTAEVSSATVADEAKSSNDSVTQLLQVASADFNTISAAVAADNVALATASVAEKKAEGILEDINVEYFATRKAWVLNNAELNQNLTVVPQNDSYQVSFNYYQSPFTEQQTDLDDDDKQDTTNQASTPGYPVKSYYVFLVKDSQKYTFSIANAENLLLNASQYLEVPTATGASDQASATVFSSQLKDSDNNGMQIGKKYVVFVLTVFTEDYKKGINVFDDFLSAPSATFALTTQLISPIPSPTNLTVSGQTLNFIVAAQPNNSPVEYRCMYLPDNTNLIKGLLSEQALRTIEEEVRNLEKISNKYDPLLNRLQAQVTNLQASLTQPQTQLTELNSKLQQLIQSKAPQAEIDKVNKRISDVTAKITQINNDITTTSASLTTAQTEMNTLISALAPPTALPPGFFFNRKIAEQVSSANYTIATIPPNTVVKAGTTQWMATIDDSTTDNFGNPLIANNKYIPVVLTVSKALEENQDQFTSSLSDYTSTTTFTYTLPAPPAK